TYIISELLKIYLSYGYTVTKERWGNYLFTIIFSIWPPRRESHRFMRAPKCCITLSHICTAIERTENHFKILQSFHNNYQKKPNNNV
ncbi:hypothetical protein C0J52_15338, partial [Blattella germanica]